MSERRPKHWLRLALADLVGMAGDELELQGRALQRRAALTYQRLHPDERPITERIAEQARKMEKEGLKKGPRPEDNPLLRPLRECCVCGHHRAQHTASGCVPACFCTGFFDRAWARSNPCGPWCEVDIFGNPLQHSDECPHADHSDEQEDELAKGEHPWGNLGDGPH